MRSLTQRSIRTYVCLITTIFLAIAAPASSDTLVDAAFDGKVDTVEILLENGHDIDAVSSDGYTALIAAAEVGDITIVRMLIERRANLDNQNQYGATALHKVLDAQGQYSHELSKDRVSIALLLIQNGANVGVRGFNDTTPLHVAVLRGDASVVEALLDKGADPNAKTKKGMTPIRIAQVMKKNEILDILTDR